jgi:hypothetical protein
MEELPDGQKARGQIVQLIEYHESSLEDNPTRIKFRVSINSNRAEEIIMYKKMLEYITKDKESDIMWKFQQIISHKVQVSQITLLIEWEKGEITKEPLKILLRILLQIIIVIIKRNEKRYGVNKKIYVKIIIVWKKNHGIYD